jgi:hypothetical protein
MDAFGIYRGKVVDNADPESLLRCKLVVPQVLGTETVSDWAWPCVDVVPEDPPVINTPVWVMFVGGDVDHPVYLGTWKIV